MVEDGRGREAVVHVLWKEPWSYGRVNSLQCGACAVSQGHIWVHSLIAARA